MYRSFYFAFKNWCGNWRAWISFTYLNIFYYYVDFVIRSWYDLQNWAILRWEKLFIKRLFPYYYKIASNWRNSRMYQEIFRWSFVWRIQSWVNNPNPRTIRNERNSTRKILTYQKITKIIQEWKGKAWKWNWWSSKRNLVTRREGKTFCGIIQHINSTWHTSFGKCHCHSQYWATERKVFERILRIWQVKSC